MAAFTRSWLKSRGYEDEQIEELISAHTEVTRALKSQISEAKDEVDNLKSEMGDISKVKEELKAAKNELKTTKEQLTAIEKDRDDYKSKSETINADFEKLKTETANRATAAKKEAALKAELKNGKYSDEAVNVIFDSKKDYASKVEFDDEGKAKNLESIMKEIGTAYPQYIPKSSTSGNTPATPPSNGGTTALTKKDIMAIKDTAQRQKAIAENISLFE